VVAVYWVVHHNEMDLIKGTTREFNWLNLIFLLFIVVIPFSAALLGNNWDLPDNILPDRQCYSFWYKRIPVLTYSANLIFAGISLQLVWRYAKRQKSRTWQKHILSDRASDSVIRDTFARNWIIPVATLFVSLVALRSVDVGQPLLVLVPLSYAIWSLRTAHLTHERHAADYASNTIPTPAVREPSRFRWLRWVYVAIAILTFVFQLRAQWPIWPDACGLSTIEAVVCGLIWPPFWIVYLGGFL
jgi:uncharacterized membrane protein